jgi:hypothetical protein
MRWTGHVARTGENNYAHKAVVRKHEGKRLPGRLADGCVILKWVLKKIRMGRRGWD